MSVDPWFIATRNSSKVEHIRTNPAVGVTVTTGIWWVSISGSAEVVDDAVKLQELWSTIPGGRLASLSLAKSNTGEPYDGGDSAVLTDL